MGAGTIAADDPQLTARDVDVPRQPLRVVLDSSGRTDPDARIFSDDAPVLIATTDAATHEVQTAWKERGAEVALLPAGRGVDLDALLDLLGDRDVVEVYVEGGGEVATSLLRDGLVDRLELHYGPTMLGRGGPDIGDIGVLAMSDAPRYTTVDVRRMGDDIAVVLMREGT